jgi:hypothetical protein
MPEWADWFADELIRISRSLMRWVLVVILRLSKARKNSFSTGLAGGVKSDAITFPKEAGSIHWPSFGLKDIFFCQ